MIIDIKEEFFNRLISFMENENLALYNELKELKPLNIETDTLSKARKIKTQRVKDTLKASMKDILKDGKTLSKYQIHKKSKISYVTINKYFDEILEEAKKEA